MNFVWKSWPWLSAAAMCAALAGVDALGNDGEGMARLVAALARPTSGGASALHAALFFATVWIVSSLRVHRLRALWRVGSGLKAMRGVSGRWSAGELKARAAPGGSVGGAGLPVSCDPAPAAGAHAMRTQEPIGGRALLDNFRG